MNLKSKLTLWPVLCGFLLVPMLASAAIYVHISGLDGLSTAAGYDKFHQFDSVQWGVGRAISSPLGGGAGRETSNPSFSEVTLTRSSDVTSPLFFFEAIAGKGHIVSIRFVTTGGSAKTIEYMKIDLENVLISSMSSSSGGDRPSESISLNFTKIRITTTEIDEFGNPGASQTKGWDLAANSAL